MKSEELEQILKTRKKELSKQEFLTLLIDLLEENPTEDIRDILRAKLVANSFADEEKAAKYWEQCLSDKNLIQREFAALQLATLARGPDSRAYQILTKYLGEKPPESKEIDSIIERFSKLFPEHDSNE